MSTPCARIIWMVIARCRTPRRLKGSSITDAPSSRKRSKKTPSRGPAITTSISFGGKCLTRSHTCFGPPPGLVVTSRCRTRIGRLTAPILSSHLQPWNRQYSGRQCPTIRTREVAASVLAPQSADGLLGECQHQSRVVIGLLRLFCRVLLCGNEVDVAVEGPLALLPQPLRCLSRSPKASSEIGREAGCVLEHEPSDIVNSRGLDAHCPQHRLESQLDQLLGLSNDVRVITCVTEVCEGSETRPRLPDVSSRQVFARHGQVKASPGWMSGFKSQYQVSPRQMRREPRTRSRARSPSRYPARKPSSSCRIRASSTRSRNSGLPCSTSAGVLRTGERLTGTGAPGWTSRSARPRRRSTARNSSPRGKRPGGRSRTTISTSTSEPSRGVRRPTDPNTATETRRAP